MSLLIPGAIRQPSAQLINHNWSYFGQSEACWVFTAWNGSPAVKVWLRWCGRTAWAMGSGHERIDFSDTVCSYILIPVRFPEIEGASGNVSEHHTSRSSWLISRTVCEIQIYSGNLQRMICYAERHLFPQSRLYTCSCSRLVVRVS